MKMKSGNERKKIIRELLNRTDQEFTDEELIHQLIMTNITENSNETEKLYCGIFVYLREDVDCRK